MKRTYYLLIFYSIFFCSAIVEENNTTIKIGKQEWLTKNLDVSFFNNGDSIQEASSYAAWNTAAKKGEPAWCYYSNNSDSGKVYGKLYNWFAVNDARGLAPKGFHIPTKEEWIQLIEATGNGKKAASDLKSNSGWYNGINGSNKYKFDALPGGYRSESVGFDAIGAEGYYWTKTIAEREKSDAYHICFTTNGKISAGIQNRGTGFSVRCIKD